MFPIEYRQLRYNVSYNRNSDIKYICVHTTGNPSRGADVETHWNYFSSQNRNASADWFVDDRKIVCFNKDFRNTFTWAVGDGGGAYGITNRNSTSIEMCINSDSDFNVVFNQTVELTKYLMKTLNIPSDRVVRHYDASRKICPRELSANNWSKWYLFKSLIGGASSNVIQVPYGIYKLGSTGDNVATLQKRLNQWYGYNLLVVDGDFGKATENAVKIAQKNMGLEPDGIVGTNTINGLNKG